MASNSREIVTHAIIEALHESDAICIQDSQPSAHPRRFLVRGRDKEFSLWVYSWQLSSGGRRNLPGEFRIQMTTVSSPLLLNPNGPTVLLGYYADQKVFAGFDLQRHSTFTAGSPSVQVRITTLNTALQDGLSFQAKSNEEVVVGVRPDLLLFYIENSRILHGFGDDEVAVQSIQSAVRDTEANSLPPPSLDENRQRVVVETSRWSRSASFRKQVLQAYDNRCAVTRHQLRLVEAAHILPVSAGQESIDRVQNGLALSPTYHRAFDRGLIFLDGNMEMHLNTNIVDELRELRLDGGIEAFESFLGPIHLPLTPEARPDPHYIELANRFRGLVL